MLLLGYSLALTGLLAQFGLAELAARRPVTARVRWEGYAAMVLAAAASAAVAALDYDAQVSPIRRGLQVTCFGVALVGAVAMARTITGLLAPERR
jgi:hypothetical protein